MTSLYTRTARQPAPPERLMTIEEVCRKLGGVKPWTVRMWVSQRKIPFTKVGRLTRFPEARIDRWISENTVTPDG